MKQAIRSHLAAALWGAVDLVLPPRCVVSGEPVERQGMVAPRVWLALNFIVDPCCVRCGMPFEFEADKEAECGRCLQHPPRFDRARAALKYDEASRDLILSFKHADKTHLVKAFAPWLMRAGGEMLERADYIAPVPLHRWRLIKRRYNQAALMAKELAAGSSVPHLSDLLLRTRPTASQGHLREEERRKNVRRAFDLNPRYKNCVNEKTIILVDDVYTTGATADECAAVLKRAGAAAVFVLTLAKVVKA